MATGAREYSEKCAVCLQTFRVPKFFDCHHSFCAECIQGLADNSNSSAISCPICRRLTHLPLGGVAALKSNFYIKNLKRRTIDMCKIHKNKKLEFYCVECQEAICQNCKLITHEGHGSEDLSSAAFHQKKELETDQDRLQCAVSTMAEYLTSLEDQRERLRKKKETVEKNIQNRHALQVAAADTARDEALKSLTSLCTDLDEDLQDVVEEKENKLKEILNIQQQLNDTVNSGGPGDIVTVAKEMKSGRGSKSAVKALMPEEKRDICYPVLHFNVSSDVMIQTAHDFMGKVTSMKMKDTHSDMKITKCFQCAWDTDVEVFSLCHIDTDPPAVIVTYERCGMKEDAPLTLFAEAGEFMNLDDNHVGKLSYRRYAEGNGFYPVPQPGWFATCCKSPSSAHFCLYNNLSGQADVVVMAVASTDPFSAEELERDFTIHVGTHRAFDVDGTEQYFAVVEEGKAPSHWRNVHLYQRGKETAVSTYTPPAEEYQPSDVCFYTLGEEKVLLITDELNDVIHVVQYQRGTMQFMRYLCPGCPFLIQPMAITVDVHDRLWAACRGGAVFTMEKTS